MRALALAVAVLALAACGGGDEPEAGGSGLRDLGSLEQLRDDFAAAEGTTRVVVLVAPL